MVPQRVALVIDRQVGYREAVLRGIWQFANEHGGWILRGCDLSVDQVRVLPQWKPDGVIAGLWSREVAEALVAMRVPMVDVFDWYRSPAYPNVTVEDGRIAEMALEHLLACGLRQFAFVGEVWMPFAIKRRDAFAAAVAREGYAPPAQFSEVSYSAWGYWGHDVDTPLGTWLTSLPRPIGVFCVNDDAGVRVAQVCRQVGLRVPDDVALIGVDNDDFLCSLSYPPLSSVDTGPQRVGYEAARLLAGMFAGKPPVSQIVTLPPVGVVARQSTDVLAIDDPDLIDAIRFIRQNAARRITVDDVLARVPMRRRTLERRFGAALGHGIAAEIRIAQLNAARGLLSGTDLSMPAIARRCGFASAQRFSRVFHEQTGMTPTTYRRQFRQVD